MIAQSLSVALAVVLAGCATDKVKPQLVERVRTVTVTKTVPVPCVEASEIPSESQTAFPPQPADSARNASAASADYMSLFDENQKLRAILVKCTKVAE